MIDFPFGPQLHRPDSLNFGHFQMNVHMSFEKPSAQLDTPLCRATTYFVES
jgi:hypothetical protein